VSRSLTSHWKRQARRAPAGPCRGSPNRRAPPIVLNGWSRDPFRGWARKDATLVDTKDRASGGSRHAPGRPVRRGPCRRAQGHRRAEPPARVHRVPAAGAASGACGQQDGPGRLVGAGVRTDLGRVHQLRRQARHRRPDDPPYLRNTRRQHRHPIRPDALVRRTVTAASRRARPHRQRPQPRRRPVPGAVRHPAAVQPAH